MCVFSELSCGRVPAISEKSVGAGGERFRLIGVARGALDFFDFGGMRKGLNAGVAILAAESRLNTRGVPGRMDEDIFTLFGLHPRGAAAGETGLILPGEGDLRWVVARVGASTHASANSRPPRTKWRCLSARTEPIRRYLRAADGPQIVGLLQSQIREDLGFF